MIYVTGDMHGEFARFYKKSRVRRKFDFGKEDMIIVCGDFGLLWYDSPEQRFHMEWMARLPFTVLWVQGNHENYDMIAQYPVESWNGGKARKILPNVILLERGQIFEIEGKTFFTFGGAQSHDAPGGIFDRDDPDYGEKVKRAKKRKKPYRVKNLTWWEQELPTQEEMEEGFKNLNALDYQVDYVITHCASGRVQDLVIEGRKKSSGFSYEKNYLTEYFDRLEETLVYRHWYFGHYHEDREIDDKHTLLYYEVIPLS